MRSGQDAIGISLLQGALLASLVDLGCTTGNIASFNAASLELRGAVSERGSLDRAEEFSTLGGFVGNVMSWMG